MEPVYPKDNGSLERARQAFIEKVKNWKWVDYDENPSTKPKKIKHVEIKTKIKKPMSEYQNKFFNF